MINLISNALKFTDQGAVTIHTKIVKENETHAFFNCSIVDTGIGIPSQELNNIFGSFEQVDSSSSRRFGGTGLGLTIVQKLIELMGGHITVDSDVTEGSTFSFVIPLEIPSNTEAPPTLSNQNASPPPSAKVLVVEDNAVNLKVATAILKKLGLNAETAENGLIAVERIKSHNFDLILMDCEMPVMDGYEATLQIRQFEIDKNKHRTPIVALTANAMQGIEEKCLNSGMDCYIPKPVKKETLHQVLKRFLV